ncbi:MAG: hypothetical protein RIS70_3282 [Planctomycetota bacterium]|jgi:prephenate dehydrogenase
MAKTTVWETVTIVGVGLLGGSIGLALHSRKLARQVIGVGRNQSSLKKALARHAIDVGTTNLEKGSRDAELIVVCTPIADVVETVKSAAKCCRPEALITDVGSTKASIVAALDYHLHGRFPSCHGYFIGSHPIAGSEKSGPEHASDSLFENRNVILTPTSRTREDHLSRLIEFWTSLGARTTQMTPAVHDETMACVSHLPHLVAAALAGVTAKKYLPLVGSGWRDTTRVASGDVELWAQIFADNRKWTSRGIDKMIDQLRAFRRAMEREEPNALRELLQEGKAIRDAVGN